MTSRCSPNTFRLVQCLRALQCIQVDEACLVKVTLSFVPWLLLFIEDCEWRTIFKTPCLLGVRSGLTAVSSAQSTAKELYLVTDTDLKKLGHLSRSNPHHKDWAPLTLYMQSQARRSRGVRVVCVSDVCDLLSQGSYTLCLFLFGSATSWRFA